MTYHLVFDKFPSPEGSRFIELEDSTGHSISAGEWRERKDGYVELVLPAPAGWQDIATAPRDGTRIDVWRVSGRVTNVYWRNNGWYWDKGYPVVYQRLAASPTHWQPLPSPPKPLSYEGEQS